MTSLKLPPDFINKIKSLKPIFVHAQELTGVPWQAIAAVFYRESFSVTPPKTPGGSFQFDPPPKPDRLDWLLHTFAPSLTETQRAELVKKGVNDFAAGAIFCACWLRYKSKAIITPKATMEQIKDAFWGYNGRKFGSADKSFYVMNGFDEKHMNMRIIGTIPDDSQPGGRRKINTIDKRPGALTVYKQLLDEKV